LDKENQLSGRISVQGVRVSWPVRCRGYSRRNGPSAYGRGPGKRPNAGLRLFKNSTRSEGIPSTRNCTSGQGTRRTVEGRKAFALPRASASPQAQQIAAWPAEKFEEALPAADDRRRNTDEEGPPSASTNSPPGDSAGKENGELPAGEGLGHELEKHRTFRYKNIGESARRMAHERVGPKRNVLSFAALGHTVCR